MSFLISYLKHSHDARPKDQGQDEGHKERNVVEKVVHSRLHSAVGKVQISGRSQTGRDCSQLILENLLTHFHPEHLVREAGGDAEEGGAHPDESHQHLLASGGTVLDGALVLLLALVTLGATLEHGVVVVAQVDDGILLVLK